MKAQYVALLCMLLVAGCSKGPVAQTPTATPRAKGTPVPPVLRTYASLTYPLVNGSVGETRSLLTKMKTESISSLGNDCSAAGGDLSNAQSSFHGTFTPKAAGSVSRLAQTGYMLSLVATDECGMASDTNSKAQLKTARSDLDRGLKYLEQANTDLSLWSTQNTP